MLRFTLILLILVALCGCSKVSHSSSSGEMLLHTQEPETFVSCTYYAIDNEIIYLLFLKKQMNISDFEIDGGTFCGDGGIYLRGSRRDETGKTTKITLTRREGNSPDIFLVDKNYRLSDGNIFLATAADDGIKVEQVNQLTERLDWSHEEHEDAIHKVVMELVDSNDTVRPFVDSSER